jgi:peptidoglycan/xylan/chitin deacetylase (PgdA/CDA1 family)
MGRIRKTGLCIALALIICSAALNSAYAAQFFLDELLVGDPHILYFIKEGPAMRTVQLNLEKPAPEPPADSLLSPDSPEPVLDAVHDPESPEVVLDPGLDPEPVPQKRIALTFDDGPDLNNTPKILDILKDAGVPATFFVLGYKVARYPEMTMRIYEEGHLIANHSQTHADLSLLSNEEILSQELEPTSQAVERLTGLYPMIMRPPYGSLRQDSVTYLRERGWRIVRWSLDTFDWDSSRNSPEEIIERIQLGHHDKAIVLMHCNGATTIAALPEIITILRDLGYHFATVDQL